MLEKVKASRDTSSGSSHLAASGNAAASGSSHPAASGSDLDANLPNSAGFATIQEPIPFLKNRLRQKIAAPYYGMQFATTPSATLQAATPCNKAIKRKNDDRDSQAHRAKIQNIGDARVPAPASDMANQVSGKRKSCGDRHPAESRPLSTHRTQRSPGAIAGQPNSWQTDISTLPQLDAAILQQVRH